MDKTNNYAECTKTLNKSFKVLFTNRFNCHQLHLKRSKINNILSVQLFCTADQ